PPPCPSAGPSPTPTTATGSSTREPPRPRGSRPPPPRRRQRRRRPRTRPPPRPGSPRSPRSTEGGPRYPARTISTEHGAWCDTLLGTEPTRNRVAPVIPLLPTTIRSEPCSSATSMIASAASPTRANVDPLQPGGLRVAPRGLQQREHLRAHVDL